MTKHGQDRPRTGRGGFRPNAGRKPKIDKRALYGIYQRYLNDAEPLVIDSEIAKKIKSRSNKNRNAVSSDDVDHKSYAQARRRVRIIQKRNWNYSRGDRSPRSTLGRLQTDFIVRLNENFDKYGEDETDIMTQELRPDGLSEDECMDILHCWNVLRRPGKRTYNMRIGSRRVKRLATIATLYHVRALNFAVSYRYVRDVVTDLQASLTKDQLIELLDHVPAVPQTISEHEAAQLDEIESHLTY